jgi:phage protein D
MKEVNSKVWDYPTLQNVITEIAGRHRLSVDYPKDSYKPVRLVQSMESDWAFLNRVCKAFGYSFNVHGTHLHIWDRSKAFGRFASYHRVFTSNKIQDNQPFSVLNFEATLGRISSSNNASKSVVTVLDNQNNVHTVTSDGTEFSPGASELNKLFKKPLYYSAASLEEGLRIVDAQDKYSPIYNATIKVLYGAGAVPGGVIDLRGYSSEFDGVWCITEVKHSIKSANYITELTVFKDSKYEETPKISKVESFTTPPEAKLMGSTWVAETMRSTEYA